ncbi:MAG: hypothetical protein PHF25_08585 [Candidatus Margulisbacteria bacterium]|nr:hypothetical protein [Candidatus Margulisiibacteriota bacterium]
MKYGCSVCGLEKYSEDNQEIPMCCSEKMSPCTKVQDAEMAKFTDKDGPCDDGTGHNR